MENVFSIITKKIDTRILLQFFCQVVICWWDLIHSTTSSNIAFVNLAFLVITGEIYLCWAHSKPIVYGKIWHFEDRWQGGGVAGKHKKINQHLAFILVTSIGRHRIWESTNKRRGMRVFTKIPLLCSWALFSLNLFYFLYK